MEFCDPTQLCEDCPDPGMCMALNECELERTEEAELDDWENEGGQ